MKSAAIKAGVGIFGVLVFVWVVWTYGFCAVVVGEDEFLVLTNKYGDPKPAGAILAEEGQLGVLREVKGTGRHFINPIFFEVKRHKAKIIGPTQIGIVTSKAGEVPTNNKWVAERGQRGVWREVLGPGVYKMNPVAYTIQIAEMTRIPPGKIGVLVNNYTSEFVSSTLPPGLHKINTKLFSVTIVDVGVKHLGYSKPGREVITEQMLMKDEMSSAIMKSKKPNGGSLIFPSEDGFNIGLDVSIVYEVEPHHAIQILREYRRTDVLTNRIIEPALQSVTVNRGSSTTAKAIIQGDTRIAFQKAFTEDFLRELNNKPVKAIDALPRGLYVPAKIQLPIMQTTIKQQLKKTNEEVLETTKLQNTEEAEKARVEREIEKVKAETKREVTKISSEAKKKIDKFEAETIQKVQELRLAIAKIDQRIALIRSGGEAEVLEYEGTRNAELIRLKAEALGGRDNLVQLQFVEALPEKIPFKVLHSGEGTLWTDLKNLSRGEGAILDRVKKVQK